MTVIESCEHRSRTFIARVRDGAATLREDGVLPREGYG